MAKKATKQTGKQTTKKTAAARSTRKSTRSTATRNAPPPPPKRSASTAPAPAPSDYGSTIGGVIFLLLAGCSAISYFNTEGSVVAFFSTFMRGLLGWGFYLAAPCFLAAAILLFTAKDRPVGARVFAVVMLPVLLASVGELMLSAPVREGTALMDALNDLFQDGIVMHSGGAVGGLIANGLNKTLSIYGALPLLLLAFVYCFIVFCWGGVRQLITRIVFRRDQWSAVEARRESYAGARTAGTVIRQEKPQPGIIKTPRKGVLDMNIPLGDEGEVLEPYGAEKPTPMPRQPRKKAGPTVILEAGEPASNTELSVPSVVRGGRKNAAAQAAAAVMGGASYASGAAVTGGASAMMAGSAVPAAAAFSGEAAAAGEIFASPAPAGGLSSSSAMGGTGRDGSFAGAVSGRSPGPGRHEVPEDREEMPVQTAGAREEVQPPAGSRGRGSSGARTAKVVPHPAATVEAPPESRAASGGKSSASGRMKQEELQKQQEAIQKEIDSSAPTEDYVFPPMTLLRASVSNRADGAEAQDEVAVNRVRLEEAIQSFGTKASVVGVIRGPTVTRYDLELERGVKLAKITNLAGDIALSLGVENVRIAPIPDKISTVGVEVPNRTVSTVFLRDILDSANFSSAKSKLSFALGKDIGGNCIVGNISKLPHLLIAGTTGSGKSVCMNSLSLSLLYKARPDEVKLIMIDPKMVELGIYNGIPHLYVPVVTDPKKAAGALQWSVVEMMKRYRAFSEIGVRDLDTYNRLQRESGGETLPRVVIVIDELADLMLVASKDVEESICRVAQMGRAAGMHLVIATQRPSADVITGLMKANIPSRIAFAVSSTLESRTILDQGGAEKLIGFGDMLYAPLGSGKPTRIQGSFVSDEEREEVIRFIKEHNSAEASNTDELEEYMLKATKDPKDKSASGKDHEESAGATGDYDELLQQAADVVIEMGSCSVSLLQRRLKLGYARAARIVDQLEELGIVGEYEGAKPRGIKMDRAQWHDLQVQLGYLPAGEAGYEPAPDNEGYDDELFDADSADAEALPQ